MSEETSKLDVAEIKREALNLTKKGIAGQHSNNKVIRLCIEIERLRGLVREARPYMDEHAKHHGGLDGDDYERLFKWLAAAKEVQQ